MGVLIPDGFNVGKVILYQSKNQDYHLAFRAAEDFEWWIDKYQALPADQILEVMLFLPQQPGFDRSFGFHKDIPHDGEVLGGGLAFLRIEDQGIEVLYINGTSLAYGSMPKVLVQHVLNHYQGRRAGFKYYIGFE